MVVLDVVLFVLACLGAGFITGVGWAGMRNARAATAMGYGARRARPRNL